MKNNKIQGIIAYTLTPFIENNRGIDLPCLKLMIDRLIDNGAHAIAPLGSTGECAYLNNEEWQEVAEVSIKQVAGRVPTIVGVSDLTTSTCLQRAKFSEKIGADAIMVLPFSYWKLSEKEIYQLFSMLANSLSIPIMVYNNPATSGVDMSPEFIVKMVKEIDNVTMVKESTGDIQRMHRIHQLSDGDIPFYNGCNPLALEAFSAGATGWCTATTNLIPQLNIALYQATQEGDLYTAQDLFYRQLGLLQFVLKHGGLPTTIKAGLALQGIKAGHPRKPLLPLSDEKTNELKALLSHLT